MRLDLAIRATFMLLASRALGSWYQITFRARIHVHALSVFRSIFTGLSIVLFKISYQISKIYIYYLKNQLHIAKGQTLG
jgi:hypothetical protein